VSGDEGTPLPPWESTSPAAINPDRERFADLMEAVALRRDRAAYGALFSYYAPRVKAYLMRLGADDGLAEELAQDVMVTVWRKADLFDRTQASVSTWLFRIARNRRIDAIRRTRRPELDPNDPLLLPSSPGEVDEGLNAQDAERRIRGAMHDLPEEQKALLRAAFYDGLSHREIAERSGTPLGTVKSRLRLAFQKLRTRLEGEV
jgi:RNA polymerase sigma-70 factor, ECF subfamily